MYMHIHPYCICKIYPNIFGLTLNEEKRENNNEKKMAHIYSCEIGAQLVVTEKEALK